MARPSASPGFNQIVFLIASVRRQISHHSCSAFLLGLCLIVPGVLLGASRFNHGLSRPATAELLAFTRRARLIQSFQADPSASVPQIWEERFSALPARHRWMSHGRELWWLIWLDDGEPLLALPSSSGSSPLELHFADELHRSSFDQAPQLEAKNPSLLEEVCLRRLTNGTAVQWQPSGLAKISGHLFPALASVSHGCLSVALQEDRLIAEGPVASRPLASLKDRAKPGRTNLVRLNTPSTYLEFNSVSFQPVLGSFLNNPLIAEQLTSRYNLPQNLRAVLLDAPVALRLESLEAGPFRAGVQARLMLPADQIGTLRSSLASVSEALRRNGFRRQQRRLQSTGASPTQRSAVVWLNPQGDPSGGWSLGPEMSGQVELLLALGQAPTLGGPPTPRRLGDQRLRLRARPEELVQLGWLGPGWPSFIRAAPQLELEMTALPNQHQPGWLRLQLELR